MKNHAIHRSKIVVLLIDVVNDFAFPDGDTILKRARPIAKRLARLKEIAYRANAPVLYVNDNFGQWRSDAARVLARCLRPESLGRKFVAKIRPEERDYCVLKPMHSAFYQTPLELLLRELGATSLVLTGLTTNSCVLCTAHDAKMRNFKITVVSDCCAARNAAEHRQALANMKQMTGARIVTLASLRLKAE
jgi:nicotinamidase-related amidase